MIKVKDLFLHLINVVVSGFLNLGPGPQGVPKVETLLQYKAEDKATPSQPAIKEEEVVEVLDFEDDFEVFNRPQSPEALTGDFSHLPLAQLSQTQGDSSVPKAMGIQRKPRASLLEIMKSQAGGEAPVTTQTQKSPKHEKYIPRVLIDFSFLVNQTIGDLYFPFFSKG